VLFLYPALLLETNLYLIGNFLGGRLGAPLDLGAPADLPVGFDTASNDKPNRVVSDQKGSDP